MVQVLDASCCGHRRIMIRTSDTDVVVLAVSIVSRIPAEELWVAYGTGKHLQNIAVHTIATALGRERAFVLPMFHALTGCDSFLLRRQRQEDSLGHLGCIPRAYSYTANPIIVT